LGRPARQPAIILINMKNAIKEIRKV